MIDGTYRLFGELAHRYDLHTPPGNYKAVHEFVAEELRSFGPGAHVLDMGCGTGALVKHLREAGLDARGIDLSPEMIAVAERRLGPGVVRVQRLQELEERGKYDAMLSLSFPFNYCSGISEARENLATFHRALRHGGLLLLQVAHAANAPAGLIEEWAPGPAGGADVQFLSRFLSESDGEPILRIQYVYSCRSLNELLYEEHVLHVADVYLVAGLLSEAGFSNIRIYENCWRASLTSSPAPFILGNASSI